MEIFQVRERYSNQLDSLIPPKGVRKSSQARATELLFQQPVVTIARRHVMSVVNL
uniref:Uncharacterized protein n=1 Tax=Anguilla anguilla TaxID=7936 RepID=A0A0E9VBS0_ANGAN